MKTRAEGEATVEEHCAEGTMRKATVTFPGEIGTSSFKEGMETQGWSVSLMKDHPAYVAKRDGMSIVQLADGTAYLVRAPDLGPATAALAWCYQHARERVSEPRPQSGGAYRAGPLSGETVMEQAFPKDRVTVLEGGATVTPKADGSGYVVQPDYSNPDEATREWMEAKDEYDRRMEDGESVGELREANKDNSGTCGDCYREGVTTNLCRDVHPFPIWLCRKCWIVTYHGELRFDDAGQGWEEAVCDA